MNKLPALLLCTALISPYAFAAPAPSADAELGNVRNAIAAAEKDLQAKQAAQAKAQRALREAQAAIARTRREIARLNSQEQAGWQKLSALQAELSKLQTNISSTKAQVAALIAANYKNPQQAAFALHPPHQRGKRTPDTAACHPAGRAERAGKSCQRRNRPHRQADR